MSNSAAILTIGSLFWSQKPHRQAWRQERLVVGAATRVQAPIRYGRVSIGKPYSMVFSNSLPPEQFGWALAVPCRGVVHAFAQLIEEAEALWAAEQWKLSKPGKLAASWGAVGLLANPNRTGLDSLMSGWSARVAAEHHIYAQFPHGHGEVAAVTPGGLLAIPWPVTESGDSLDVDFVLATATAPTIPNGTYATPQVIGAACQSVPEGRKYFDETRRVGIATAFDGEILQCLESTG
jgi:hypothetical protein